uniref:CUB domain-containing protein n=1 Tax=Lepeophtheirus salmonis TaxID=72036 RepID=A0A0K2V7Q1_LEPSM
MCLCVEHFVSIYDGKTIRDPILHTLCGYVSPGESYDFNGPSILVEFSSSHVLPPYHFNGFAATIEFPTSADIDEEEEVDGLEDEDDHGEDDEEYDDDIEHDYGEDTEYEDDEIVSIPEFDDDPDEIYTAETRRNQKRKNFSQKGDAQVKKLSFGPGMLLSILLFFTLS